MKLNRMRGPVIAATAFTWFTASAVSASAAPVHFVFQAQYVSTFNNSNSIPLPDPAAGLLPNQIVTGEFSYDLAAPPTGSTQTVPGLLYAADATITLNLALGPLTLNISPTVEVLSNPNNDPNSLVFYMTASYSNPVLQANNLTIFSILSLQSDVDPFSSLALPTTFDIDDFRTALISIGTSGQPAGYDESGVIASNFRIIGIAALDAPPPSETPLPGALPLFVSGLAGVAFVAHRRKRKAAA